MPNRPTTVFFALTTLACFHGEAKPADAPSATVGMLAECPDASGLPERRAEPAPKTATLRQATSHAPKLKLEAVLAASGPPVLTLRVENVGRAPIVIDKQLVLLPTIVPIGDNRTAVRLEHVRSLERPSAAALKSRLITLKPGDRLERQLNLEVGFRTLVVGTGHTQVAGGGVRHDVAAYEAVYRLPVNAGAKQIEITFDSTSTIDDGLERYLDPVDAALLYRGPIRVTLPYQHRKADGRSRPQN